MPQHNYPSDTNPSMKKIGKNVLDQTLGDQSKKTTELGPHLKHGAGTPYHQAKLTQGFMLQSARQGHSQSQNIGKKK